MTDVATSKGDSSSKGKSAQKTTARVYGPNDESLVTCTCGCGDKAELASYYYYGIKHCSKGGPSKEFLATFKVKEVAPIKSKAGKRKSADSSESKSKANTPTKDDKGEDEDHEDAQPKKKAKVVAKDSSAEKKEKKDKKTDEEKEEGETSKRPKNAYMLFLDEHRKIMKEENPDMPKKDITKELHDRWTGMSDEDKKFYTDEANRSMAEYKKNQPEKPKKESKKKESKKSADGAKKGPKGKSGYILFGQFIRESVKEEHEGIQNTEIMKVIGAKWKELSEAEKTEWKEKAKLQATEEQEKAMDEDKDEEKEKDEGEEEEKEKEEGEEEEKGEDAEEQEAEGEDKKEEAEDDDDVKATQAGEDDE